MIRHVQRNLLLREGRSIAIFLIAACAIGFVVCKPLLYGALGVLVFCLYFFRNPERTCPEAVADTSLIVSPADGRIVDVSCDNGNASGDYPFKISIFLSVFDVHINRVPCSGTVARIAYTPGAFVPAFVAKSSLANEHNDLVLVCNNKCLVVVRQIAGIVARRIRCWVKEGAVLNVGEPYGMIIFGSRVDILLPSSAAIHVTKGQRVRGGQTVIGRWICT